MRAGAARPGRFGSGGGAGGEGAGVSSPVTVECEAVDHEGVAEQVEQLAFVPDAVGAAQPEGVIQVAVDALGVIATGVEPGEVGVGGRDDADVLGPVQLAGCVLGGSVEPQRDDAGAEVVGEAIVVVPAVAARLVGVAVRPHPRECAEVEVPSFGQLTDPEDPAPGVELDGSGAAVGEGDRPGFEPGALLDSLSVGAPRLLDAGFGGRHPVEGAEAE